LLSEYTGLESIENLGAGAYKLVITDLYGCIKEEAFSIAEPALLEITETITDVACLADDEEDFGNALNFNATDDNRIVVADNNSLDMTGALSIEAWVYANTSSTSHTLVSKVGNTTSGYSLSTSNGWASLDFKIRNGGSTTLSASGLSIEDGWHHVAATYSSSTGMKIYIDGLLSNSTGVTGGLASNSQQLTLGAKYDGTGNLDSDYSEYFDGSLDELRIWNVARSDAQINYTKEITLDGDEEGLVAYYQFNQGTAGGNNSGISSLTEGINSLNGTFPTATAFDLTGSTSNFVASYDNTPAAAATSGAIVLVVTGGSSSYSYQWFKGSEEVVGQTTANLNTASGYPIDASGEFTVVVTDNTYACSLTKKFNVEVAATLSLTGVVTTPTCKGGTDGALDITAGGGTSYDYAWTKVINDELVAGFAETTEDLSDLGDGTYDITITEQTSGCTLSKSFDVASPTTAYTIGIDITDATCQGDDDGILITSIIAEAGHPTAYSYAWYSGSVAVGTPLSTAQKRIYNLAPGPYIMEVTDDYGCIQTSTASVSEEAEITFSTATTTDVTCYEGADGAINIGLTGGNGPYTYVWYKDGDEIYPTGAFAASPPTSLTGLSTGVYRVVVQDAPVNVSPKKASCSIQAVFNIPEPEDFAVTATLVNPACQDGNSGQISVVVSGATEGSGYTYQWTKDPAGAATAAGTTATISGLTGDNPAGDDYRLVVTDNLGCRSDDLDYTLSSPLTTYLINASTTISETVTALPTETVQSNVSCNGADDGYLEVKMTVDGGHPTDFDYAWYAGTSATDPLLLVGEKNIYNLEPGQYTFQITDFYGCIKEQTYTILEYPIIDISATAVTTLSNSCSEANDASIGISVAGGNNANYTYVWYKNDVVFDPADSAWTDTALSTLAIGLYKVIVTDEQGCSANKSFEITTPEPLSLSYSQEDNICLGGNIGAIDVEVSGGTAPYDYAWKLGVTDVGDSDTLSNLTKDDYVLTVTDFAGCAPLTQTISIGGPTTAFAIGFTTTDLTCYESTDGTIALNLSLTGAHPNDYEISWYKEGDMFNSVTETLSDLEVNNYTVIVTDTYGCAKTDSITLVQPDDIYLHPVIDPLLCFDASTASITLNPTGGSDSYPSVDWSLAGTPTASDVLFVSALATGNYKVLLTDANGCKKDSVITVVNPANMSINTEETQIFDVLCKGLSTGSIEFSVENGKADYAYAWSQAGTGFSSTKDVQDLPIGTYDLIVTDDYGCVSDLFSFEITEPDNLFNINGDIKEVSCLDGSDGKIFVSLEVLGASTDFTYVWNRNGTLLAEDIKDMANLSPATYLFAATDNFGCTQTDTFELANPEGITALFDTIEPSCYGDSTGSITLSASGGWGDYEYDWRNPFNEMGINDSVVNNLLSGNYLVRITDGAGCLEHFPITLEGPEALSITAVITDNYCNTPINAGITISVTGGTPSYSYQWLENGDDYATTQNIDALTADRYELIVTDSLSCEQSSGILEVITPEPISFTVISSQDNLCTNSNTGSLFLQGSGGTFPYQYSIDGGSAGTDSFFDGLAEGVHTFSITDTNNCSADSLITVLSEYELIANFSLDYTNPYIDWPISLNDSSIATDITSWFWELGNGAVNQGQNTEVTYVAPGVYPITLKISNEVGCEAIKMDTLIIEKGYKLTMPSAFTPNDDGLNDVFTASHENIIRTSLQVYNKYGALVFESNVLNAEWNGELKEVPLPQDSYLYVIEYVAESGIARTERGRFTLLR
jgi:gliding motility-associated-like protein